MVWFGSFARDARIAGRIRVSLTPCLHRSAKGGRENPVVYFKLCCARLLRPVKQGVMHREDITMCWYHLSTSPGLKQIIKSTAQTVDSALKPFVPDWIINLKPGDGDYKEPSTPKRVSVAPSVWQCIMGLGRVTGNPEGIFYIYIVNTQIVIHRSFSSPETAITDEQWITDEIINEKIDLQLCGCIEINQIFKDIKKCTIPSNLPKMEKLKEWEAFWEKEGEIDGISKYIINKAELDKILA
jgi:hypothetical protein